MKWSEIELPSVVLGACWSFSATGAIEGINKIVTGSLISLSEQELVDCDTNYNTGCNGGLMDYAYKFVVNNHGIDTEKDYPFHAKQQSCNKQKVSTYYLVDNTCFSFYLLLQTLDILTSLPIFPCSKYALQLNRHVVTIDGYTDVPENDEDQLLQAVVKQPVSVGICGSERAFQLYSKVTVPNPNLLLNTYKVSDPWWWNFDRGFLLARARLTWTTRCWSWGTVRRTEWTTGSWRTRGGRSGGWRATSTCSATAGTSRGSAGSTCLLPTRRRVARTPLLPRPPSPPNAASSPPAREEKPAAARASSSGYASRGGAAHSTRPSAAKTTSTVAPRTTPSATRQGINASRYLFYHSTSIYLFLSFKLVTKWESFVALMSQRSGSNATSEALEFGKSGVWSSIVEGWVFWNFVFICRSCICTRHVSCWSWWSCV